MIWGTGRSIICSCFQLGEDVHELLRRAILHAFPWYYRQTVLRDLRHETSRVCSGVRFCTHSQGPSTIGSQIWGTGTPPICSTTEFCTRFSGACCTPPQHPPRFAALAHPRSAPRLVPVVLPAPPARPEKQTQQHRSQAQDGPAPPQTPPLLPQASAQRSSNVVFGRDKQTHADTAWVPIHQKELVEPTEMGWKPLAQAGPRVATT